MIYWDFNLGHMLQALKWMVEKKEELNKEIEKTKERPPTEEEKKEYRDFMIELKLGEIYEFGMKCLGEGANMQDVADLICAGLMGKQLWIIALYTGGAFCAFGPQKDCQRKEGRRKRSWIKQTNQIDSRGS